MKTWVWLGFLTSFSLIGLGSQAQEKIVPKWIYPPKTTLQGKVCSEFDTDPKNSCAYQNYKNPIATPTTANFDYNAFATDLMKKMGFTDGDISSRRAALEKHVQNYNSKYCLNKGLKACTSSAKMRGFMQWPIKQLPAIGGKFMKNSVEGYGVANISDMLWVCQQMASDPSWSDKLTLADVQSASNIVQNYLNLMNNQFAIDPSSAVLTYWPTFKTPQELLDIIKTGKGKESDGIAVGNYYEARNLPVGFRTTQTIYFCDNSDIIASPPPTSASSTTRPSPAQCVPASNILALEELVQFQDRMRRDYNLEINSIKLYSSASTQNNTANYCAKDFKKLSSDRADSVKTAIMADARFSGISVSIQSFVGLNGDGTSGPCAYQITTNDLKENIAVVTEEALADNQKVIIEVVDLRKTTSSMASSTTGSGPILVPWLMSVFRPVYNTELSCTGQVNKECWSDGKNAVILKNK